MTTSTRSSRAMTGNSGTEQNLQHSSHTHVRCMVESIEDGKHKLPPFQGDKVLNPHRSMVEKRHNQSVATESCSQELPQSLERKPSYTTDAPPVPRLDTPGSESNNQSNEDHPSPKPLETASKAMAASVPWKSSHDVPPPEASSADFPTHSGPSKKPETDYHLKYSKVTRQLNELKKYCDGLKHENCTLKVKYQTLSQSYQSLQHEHEYLEEQIRALQARNESLEIAHIKSVNSVGTGFQPVSDQEFIKRLGELHTEVNSFFRRMSKHKRISHDPLGIFPWLERASRYNLSPSGYGLKAGTILEMVFWTALEQSHNNRMAIPDRDNSLGHIHDVEIAIISADPSEQKARSEFWRSYTMSIITQGEAWEKFYDKGCLTETQTILDYLQSLIGPLSEHESGEIFKFVKFFFEISTDLSRQRSWYEFDNAISPGWSFDSNSMEDFKNSAEDDLYSPWIVEAVVSRGLVRKQHRFAKNVQKQVIKARVVLCRGKAYV